MKIYKIKTILVSEIHFPSSVIQNINTKNVLAIRMLLLIKSFLKDSTLMFTKIR